MSHFRVKGFAATLTAALMISGTAYAAAGGNGAPGPAGNPNQPAAQPQANAPQGPAGNDAKGKSQSSQGKSQSSHGKSESSHGKSQSSHGKSEASHGKSGASHGKSESSHGKSESAPSRSNGSHANPTPGTPRSGNGNNGHAGKITICHATKSVTHPYVEITISVNGLNGHGPADDPRHHAGSWKDIIPAPAGGCPTTVQQPSPGTSTPGTTGTTDNSGTAGTQETNTTQSGPVAAFRELTPGAQEVLGARAHGTTPGNGTAPANEVLGANASGTAPAAALAAHPAGSSHGSLPFTGLQLAVLLLAAAAALLGGYALRRATVGNRS